MSIVRDWSRYLRRFSAHQGGAAVVIFGLIAVPVISMVGASVDYSRASGVKVQLQGAVDAAILAAAHNPNLSDEDLEAQMRQVISALVGDTHGAYGLQIELSRNGEDDLLHVHVTADIDTTLLAIMGVDEITVSVESAVGTEITDMEVALVLDNTGSMRSSNRIGSLREAALDFVEIVSADNPDNLKISLVPYTAQVNIGNGATMEQYLDQEGLSQHHAAMIEGHPIARRDTHSCRNAHASVRSPVAETQFAAAPEAGDLRHVPGFSRLAFLDAFGELLGVSVAEASSGFPYDYVVEGCFIYNPDQISHWQLYDQLAGVDWKGCVEARPEPFDVTDTPPDTSTPDTLWVPAFWIDDDDYDHQNDWLDDRRPSGYDWYEDGEYYSVYKYASSSGNSVDEVPNTTRGPAQNCGDPILPLTDDFDLVEDRIDDMTYWRGGGTVTAQGVVWGWRTLSPGHPFTEGVPYGEATKVMVVMTDGRNELVSASNPALGSHYSAYGHVANGRFPSENISAALNYINERTEAACTNAKGAGIRVYTVTFGLDSNSRAMWDRCATEPSMAYHVNSSSELISAFTQIAETVGELRLTR